MNGLWRFLEHSSRNGLLAKREFADNWMIIFPPNPPKHFMKNHSKSLLITALFGSTVASQGAYVVYSDDFSAADGTYNGSTAVSAYGVSALAEYNSGAATIGARYASGVLQMDDGSSGSSGLAFGGSGSRFNWATSSFVSDLITGGMTIDVDFNFGNGGDFVSIGVGDFTGIPSGGANSGFGAIYGYNNMDWGWRTENDRQITFLANDTTSANYVSSAFAAGNGQWFHATVEFDFSNGFGAGAVVGATTTISKDSTVLDTRTESFTLTTANTFFMDFSVNEAGTSTRMDNLVITTVPEPSAALLGGLGLLGLLRRRRA